MSNAADRQFADTGLLGEPASEQTPAYPVIISHVGGNFPCGQAFDTLPSGLEFDFEVPYDFNSLIDADQSYRIVLGWFDDPHYSIFTIGGVYRGTTGFSGSHVTTHGSTRLHQGKRYRAEIWLRDTANLEFKIWEVGGGAPLTGVGLYGQTGWFTQLPTLSFGFPPAAVLAVPIDNSDLTRVAGENITIYSVGPANPGPTLEFTPEVGVSATAPIGTKVGTFVYSHPRLGYQPLFNYQGDEDTSTQTILNSFVLLEDGVTLVKNVATMTAVEYTVYGEVVDIYGKSANLDTVPATVTLV